MEQEFKVKDCVRLINGYTPDMTLTEINEEEKTAHCVWFNINTKKMESANLPLTALTHCPEKTSAADIRSVLGR
jgi:uncharacterized protein YodC (DUF2158 family)